MKRACMIFAALGLATAVFAAGPVMGADTSGPEKAAAETEKGPSLKDYDLIKHIDPFSPDPPKKPAPPKPKPQPKPKPKPKKKIKVKPDNLHLAGVTFDNPTKKLVAMIEIDGKGVRFLPVGDKVGTWKIDKVDMKGVTVKDPQGEARHVRLGERFHDGVTIVEKYEDGSSVASPSSSSPTSSSSSGGSSAALDDAKRREIIERLKARRAAAMRNRNK